jgi:hypothetical protein
VVERETSPTLNLEALAAEEVFKQVTHQVLLDMLVKELVAVVALLEPVVVQVEEVQPQILLLELP